jgi:transposase
VRHESTIPMDREANEWLRGKHGVVTPSDFLTEAEQAKLNGPVTTYVDERLIDPKIRERERQQRERAAQQDGEQAGQPQRDQGPQGHEEQQPRKEDESMEITRPASTASGTTVTSMEVTRPAETVPTVSVVPLTVAGPAPLMAPVAQPTPPTILPFTAANLEAALLDGKREPELLAMFGVQRSFLYKKKREWKLTMAIKRTRSTGEKITPENIQDDVQTLERLTLQNMRLTIGKYAVEYDRLKQQIAELTKRADGVDVKRRALEYALHQMGGAGAVGGRGVAQ